MPLENYSMKRWRVRLEVCTMLHLVPVGDEKNKQKFWNSQENSDDAIKAVELLTGYQEKNFLLRPNRRV